MAQQTALSGMATILHNVHVPHDMAYSPIGMRILVIGTTGSGKSTLARTLSDRLGIPHIELDDLHWDANWTPSPHFEDRVANVLQKDKHCWIVDGNFPQARDILWDRVDTVIWLDYPIWVNFVRLWCRCWKRWWYQIPLWHSGNIECIWKHFTSPSESLFVWLWRMHPINRQRYSQLRKSDTTGRRWIHFQSPKATQRWLDQEIPTLQSKRTTDAMWVR